MALLKISKFIIRVHFFEMTWARKVVALLPIFTVILLRLSLICQQHFYYRADKIMQFEMTAQ